jgi:hypothetical protein
MARTKTSKMELVETANIAESLARLMGPNSGGADWRRAFYHALSMVTHDRDRLKAVREALQIP